MTSNQKPAQPKESAVDPFKRAVAGCMRAIAGKPELEVTFAADRPMLSGTQGAAARAAAEAHAGTTSR